MLIGLHKPGFIGREALLTAPRGSLLLGVKSKQAPEDGAEVLNGCQAVGRVTIGAWSPYLEHGIGYVRFSRHGDWAGQRLKLKSAAGELVDCEILGRPRC